MGKLLGELVELNGITPSLLIPTGRGPLAISWFTTPTIYIHIYPS